MRNFILREVVRDLALRREQEAREQGSSADFGQSSVALQASVVEDVRTLIGADVIAPMHPGTNATVAKDSPFDESWHLNRRDFERVQKYAWHHDPKIKKRYLDEFTAVFHDGRYKLGDAGEAFEMATGERGELLVEKLKASALSGDLPMYEPYKLQRYAYFVNGKQITKVRDFVEEAYWHDLNAWLEKYEPRLTYRFPPPNLPEPPGMDTAATTPGVRALLLGGIENHESSAGAPAETPPAQQAWPWHEDQIIRATKSLEYNPLALPPDDRKNHFYVKSLIRARCAKNHPVKMRKALFDKAWERMMGSSPPTLKYAK